MRSSSRALLLSQSAFEPNPQLLCGYHDLYNRYSLQNMQLNGQQKKDFEHAVAFKTSQNLTSVDVAPAFNLAQIESKA